MYKGLQKHQDLLEVAVQKERILIALNKIITKLEISLVLSTFVEEYLNILPNYLNKEEIECMVACSELFKNINGLHRNLRNEPDSFGLGTQGNGSIAQEKATSFQAEKSKFLLQDQEWFLQNKNQSVDRNDPAILRAIEIIYSKPEILTLLKEHKRERATPAAENFLICMNKLKKILADRLSVTAVQHFHQKLHLRDVKKRNVSVVEDIDNLNNILFKHQEENGIRLSDKKIILSKHVKQIEKLKKKGHDDVMRRIIDSERNMRHNKEESEQEQEYLRNEYKNIEDNYDQLLQQHLKREKELRMQRKESEAKLLIFLEKYDSEMNIRQAEIDLIMQHFNEELKQKQDLQFLFDEQEVTYDELMAQKAEEERKDFEDRMFAFLLNRAARRVQTYWRTYWANKIARKKSKKRGKKK